MIFNDKVMSVVADFSGGGSAEGAVLYTEQELTTEQQEQARKNIGAMKNGEADCNIQMYGNSIVGLGDIAFSCQETGLPIHTSPNSYTDTSGNPLHGILGFSHGYQSQKVRLTHIEDGIFDTDAVTVGQLNTAISNAVNAMMEIFIALGLVGGIADDDGSVLAESDGTILCDL